MVGVRAPSVIFVSLYASRESISLRTYFASDRVKQGVWRVLTEETRVAGGQFPCFTAPSPKYVKPSKL